MKKEEELNFYEMGKRRAEQTTIELNNIAEKIEKEYGIDARIEFEVGIAETIILEHTKLYFDTTKDKKIEGTFNYGSYEKRNNSYFGSRGISNKYNGIIYDGFDGIGIPVYNEPSKVYHDETAEIQHKKCPNVKTKRIK